MTLTPSSPATNFAIIAFNATQEWDGSHRFTLAALIRYTVSFSEASVSTPSMEAWYGLFVTLEGTRYIFQEYPTHRYIVIRDERSTPKNLGHGPHAEGLAGPGPGPGHDIAGPVRLNRDLFCLFFLP
ncbi:hypothetical protein AMTR_s00048p00045100 [Amborella trichopoda]|uniref:Uncharacterized protein n=1 Tax=Amborella trichopoda TaxID=13333 RepID=U5CZS9_AMBTC|nr:hypothetical protein AMTR_s00048p00045100 [Amborella trichopoda]